MPDPRIAQTDLETMFQNFAEKLGINVDDALIKSCAAEGLSALKASNDAWRRGRRGQASDAVLKHEDGLRR